jgi:uncharacterized membrane protein YedE/YeeE
MQPTSANERPLWNPYLAGLALGLVLLASFVVLGFGLGASGASNRAGIFITHKVAPQAVEDSAYMGKYIKGKKHVLDDWLIFSVLGVFLGGAVGSLSAGRMRRAILRGPNISPRNRILLAVLGGVLAGIGARLARGCASGQGLTGGALLSAGGWVFMMLFFVGAFLAAPLVRRQWK